jgi:hypothetical protein
MKENKASEQETEKNALGIRNREIFIPFYLEATTNGERRGS